MYCPLETGKKMSPAEAMNTTPSNGRKIILVVDDEQGIRDFLATYLKTKNFKVFAAASGPEAIKVWEEQDGHVHLLLTDMIMPGMNGKQLADQLEAQKPGLKVIFMSGFLPQEIGEEYLNHLFLKKPFHPNELMEAIGLELH
jgi:two-component system cell cycle sensor histidine kinase/response regulator CckA